MRLGKAIIATVVAFTALHALAKETTVLVEKELFDAIDADSNGTISIEEAKINTKLTNAFSTLDVNGDKELTLEEFVNIRAKV